MEKLRITIDADVNLIDENGIPTKTIEEIKRGIILYSDDVVDGFVISTDISGCDSTSNFFLKDAVISSIEIIGGANTTSNGVKATGKETRL